MWHSLLVSDTLMLLMSGAYKRDFSENLVSDLPEEVCFSCFLELRVSVWLVFLRLCN